MSYDFKNNADISLRKIKQEEVTIDNQIVKVRARVITSINNKEFTISASRGICNRGRQAINLYFQQGDNLFYGQLLKSKNQNNNPYQTNLYGDVYVNSERVRLYANLFSDTGITYIYLEQETKHFL